ncbi:MULTISPECIES: quinone oxidoreductase [unclassified Chelatococcus]|uniref:quinone oxidoreductase family protein n=1 Tax=unclassified Chelatococcus TaxID=2638111 RepID=UPI001BCCC351|nr:MULTISPECIES: quinone oxidoreductase [unclassified Chelatococcus]CAH1670361.1 Quinone oxidoreductase [Hyphomicrobiales bacterium]MBS7738329.1 quinone oxidoreductase [Chelatococcus sp. HY11]MBX3545857.1 quinone oxidoreductase [Chelatococcus sp.]MCO5077325.1 quinone oxidoreductase [Chelatococcus sp.]CAH1677406.1 Quinone oxidoreductase [Hyphomicrobiales bacterium]
MKAIRVHAPGGPETLRFEDVEVGQPGPGEVRIRQLAIGLNFLDVYHRSGLYPLPTPFIPGSEGAGEVVSVGEGVDEFVPGDRVAYAGAIGAYAEERLVPASVLVHLPGAIDFETAAAIMLKGLTAQYLLRRTFKVEEGQTILFHAAAGGVGLIATQWAKHLGATVIGTVGSPEKAELAKAHGCDHVILYREEDFAKRVRDITNGQGCAVVYDSVGKATFPASLDCLTPLGMFVSFGSSSGQIDAFNINILSQKGSLFATRPSLNAYIARRSDLVDMAADLFHVVQSGAVQVRIEKRYALADAEAAHRALEGRTTTGATVLLP